MDLWKSKETWSVSEGVKLICGRDPYARIPGPQIYNRRTRVIDIIDQAFAAAQRGEIKILRSGTLAIHTLVEPSSFVRWAISSEFEVPENLKPLADSHPFGPEFNEALLKERVKAIAHTLWVLYPNLTASEVTAHSAMRVLVGDDEALPIVKLRWVSEAQENL